MENISGVAQQMRNHDFDQPVAVHQERSRKKRREEAAPQERGGFFWSGLTPELQQSLVEYTRRAAAGARADGRLVLAAHDEEKLQRREERVMTLLNAAVEQYAYALELFDAWAAQRAHGGLTKPGIKTALLDEHGKPKPEAQQLEWLRRQIEMRVLGCGWTKFATRWSSQADSRIGTVAHLWTLLEEILDEERSRARFPAGSANGLPTEAAPPHHAARDVGQLGTADADAMEIAARALFSAEELRAKAQQERQRRIEAGIADGVEAIQPDEAPAFDQQLVGKRLEVLWKYVDKDSNEPQLIWATGRVKRVADGLTDKRSSRAKKILPAGALLWAWDADPEFEEAAGEQWLILLPKKWNRQQHYGWRFDPRELGAARATTTSDERRKQARREVGALDAMGDA